MGRFSGLLGRFLDYTAYDTMSLPQLAGRRRPTSEGQERLLLRLLSELQEAGIDAVYGSEKVVMGRLPGNAGSRTVGFMAHVDTADDVPGNGVKARVWDDYDGSDIELGGITIKADENPDLALYRGSTVITGDGTTLLGADDKAGAAIIMEVISYLASHPEIPHPEIEVFFTPDEETGSGMDSFPFGWMRSSCCYTLDGGREGEVETECFNAASAVIRIHGDATHFGSGRGRMHNAVTAAAAMISALPQAESPEATDGSYGYFCADGIEGSVAETSFTIHLRDFEAEGLERRKAAVRAIAEAVSLAYHVRIDADIQDQYRNMGEASFRDPFPSEAIVRAAGKLGFPVSFGKVRGGTDGARLAERGIPSPNLYTGGHCFHSLSEWIALEAMERSAELMLAIIQEWAR